MNSQISSPLSTQAVEYSISKAYSDSRFQSLTSPLSLSGRPSDCHAASPPSAGPS